MSRLTSRMILTALLAATMWTGRADAAAIQSYVYTTNGDIAGASGSGAGLPIAFLPQSYTEMMTTPGSFNLGTILTNPLPTGATLTYDNTPFAIKVNVAQLPDNSSGYTNYSQPYPYLGEVNPAYIYKIAGVLNGSLTGQGVSTLFPTVTSITGSGSTPPFPIEDLKFNLQGIAAPNGSTYGSTTLTAYVDVTGTPLPSPAPEPTSVAAFAVAIAGWVWQRRRLAGRNASS